MSDLAEPRREYVPPEVNRIAILTHENARLQAREAELEELLFADHEVDEALTARVIKAEAQAERRGEALAHWKQLRSKMIECGDCVTQPWCRAHYDWAGLVINEMGASLAATPEDLTNR